PGRNQPPETGPAASRIMAGARNDGFIRDALHRRGDFSGRSRDRPHAPAGANRARSADRPAAAAGRILALAPGIRRRREEYLRRAAQRRRMKRRGNIFAEGWPPVLVFLAATAVAEGLV